MQNAKLKKLLFALLISSALLGKMATAQNVVTFTLSITNTPTNLASITINSATRTWVTAVTNPATQILITNDLGQSATNLMISLTGNPIAGIDYLNFNGTNGIIGSGAGLTESVTAGWCSNVLTMNASTPAYGVSVPFNSAYPVASDQTNTANYLIVALDTYGTSAFSAGDAALQNYVGLTGTQTITGAKTFSSSSSSFNNGTVSNSIITNSPSISGNGGTITNLALLNPTMTNGQNFGNAFRSPGSGTNSEQFGIGATSTAPAAASFGDGATASGPNTTAIGEGTSAAGAATTSVGAGANSSGSQSTSIGNGAATGSFAATAIGSQSLANQSQTTALGALTQATNANSTAVGEGAATTVPHQIMFGTSSEFGEFAGNLQVDGNVTNLLRIGNGFTAAGTNILGGVVAFSRTNNSSLANGINAGVLIGTNETLNISGPSGAFTICGVVPAGIDQQQLTIVNATGFAMTIANQSGGDPTAANRFLTGQNADVTDTNNPGVEQFRYFTSVSRWIRIGHN